MAAGADNKTEKKLPHHNELTIEQHPINTVWTQSLTPQRLWAVFFIQCNEGYQINVLYPFVVFMIRDFNFTEDAVGLYAGLLTAAFALSQFISSYFWGAFSDKYGRKTSLLIGLLISGFAIIIFGTSTRYFQAIAARSISGIFNGNIGVARAYVADMTNSRNRAYAFSILPVAFSVGIVFGSICGGLLIHTYDLDEYGNHKPSVGVLQWWIFGTQFPYLLPCVIGAVLSFVAFAFTMAFVEDLTSVIPPLRCKSLPILSRHRFSNSYHFIELHNRAMSTNALYDERVTLLGPTIDSLASMFRETSIIHGLVINSTIMVLLIAWNALAPLLLAQILGMDSVQIGIFNAYCGFVLFAFTWWIQPSLLKRFNYKSLYIGSGTAMLFVLIIFPSLTLIPGINNWSNASVVMLTSFIGSFKFAFATNLFVVSLCFVNNSVPDSVLGRANGLAQALSAGLRGLGPLIGGSLWSWSMTLDSRYAVYIAYIFMVIPTGYSVAHCACFINSNIQMTWSERHGDCNK